MSARGWAWGVVTLTLGVRLILLLAASAQPSRFYHEPDSSGYERLALNLLHHGRFSLDERPPFKPDHTRTPAYPSVLAGLYALTGRSPVAAVLLNALAATATVAGVVFIGGRLLGRAPALLTGTILAMDPTSAAYSTALLTEALFTLLLTLALLCLLAAVTPGSAARLGASSALLGLASLTRPIGLYLPLFLSGAFALRREGGWRRTLAGATALVLGVAVLTFPWAFRNLMTGGRFELSAIGTVNMYYHRAGALVADATATSRETARGELAARLATKVAIERLSEDEAYRLMDTWAREAIAADPGRYMRLHLEGIFRMLGPDPEPIFQVLGWLGQDRRPRPDRERLWGVARAGEGIFVAGLYLAAAAGVWIAARTGRGWMALPAVLTIAYGFLVAGPEVYPRFRVPLMPWFAWLASLGLVRDTPATAGRPSSG